ncbi:MAG: hypothetical protein M3P29_12920 [Acidobacteriota bacterium]|nr:hypothetical protein [Acidobacteriota bacterium]
MRDRRALAGLYDRHASRLYAIALRITGDRDAAGDALAEAFLALGRMTRSLIRRPISSALRGSTRWRDTPEWLRRP